MTRLDPETVLFFNRMNIAEDVVVDCYAGYYFHVGGKDKDVKGQSRNKPLFEA